MMATSRARVIFVNRFYWPDISATSQMLTDLSVALAARGIEVHVVTSRLLYEDPQSDLPGREVHAGVHVHRVRTASFGRGSLLGRAVDYASFYVAAGARLLQLARPSDVIVAKTDPPMMSVIAAVVARLRRAVLVNWLQDVFPEIAVRLNALPLPRPLERLLRGVRDWSLRASQRCVVLGPRMREHLLGSGVASDRISIIENWADAGEGRPLASADSELRRREGLQSRFVVGYSGNLGRAHDYETLLDAARRLAADTTITFLMIGGGAGMKALQAQARALGLGNVMFLPYQPRERLADSLAAADVHVVSLLADLEGLILPSKVYGILAAGRPVVFIGDPCGEVGAMLSQLRCGVSVPSGAGETLAGELCALRDDRALLADMGARGRAAFEERYTLERAVERWVGLLEASGVRADSSYSGMYRDIRAAAASAN